LPPQPGTLDVLHLPLAARAFPGRLDPANARQVLALLDRALAGCQSRRIRRHGHRAGAQGGDQRRWVPFSGHTEYLAERRRRIGWS
jgi:4-hydroxythreonine-4-phosphate dehydrogenase